MPLSIFVLALWVFLQSGAGLGWFTVDPKLLGWVGVVFVVSVLVEALWLGWRGRPLLPYRAFHRGNE